MTRRWRRLCAAALLAAACSPAPDPVARTEPVPACTALAWDGVPRRRNLVLIVNDTMRRDRLGAYGGRARTPAFDAFAAGGFHLTRMSSQAPWTKPSIATLFTGLYPSQHGLLTHPALPEPGQRTLRDHREETDVLAEEAVTMAEVLRDAGYRTAAFVANPWMKRRFGFAQGFDVYEDTFVQGWHVPGALIVERALAWLEAQAGDGPWFLYLHTIDSHGPYGRLTPEDLARHAERIESDRRPLPERALPLFDQIRLADGRTLRRGGVPQRLAVIEAAYEKGIEDFDHALAAFLDAFDASPAAADTAVIVTSDHGEALFERGWGNHGQGLHADEIGVPFAARMPGVATRGAVDCPSGLIDVLATLCTYLGVPCPEPSFGVSLLRAPGETEPPAPRYVVAEGVMWRPAHRAIDNGHYKLLSEPDGRPRFDGVVPPLSLFAVDRDPDEREDLLADGGSREGRAVLEVLAPRLVAAVPAYAGPAATRAPLEEDDRERLRALGYLDAEPAPDESTSD